MPPAAGARSLRSCWLSPADLAAPSAHLGALPRRRAGGAAAGTAPAHSSIDAAQLWRYREKSQGPRACSAEAGSPGTLLCWGQDILGALGDSLPAAEVAGWTAPCVPRARLPARSRLQAAVRVEDPAEPQPRGSPRAPRGWREKRAAVCSQARDTTVHSSNGQPCSTLCPLGAPDPAEHTRLPQPALAGCHSLPS